MRLVRSTHGVLIGLLLVILVTSIGTKLGTRGIGLVILVIALALVLPLNSQRMMLHTSGVAHHSVGDPTGLAGIGAVLRSDSGEVLGEIEKGIGVATNTVADYTALLEGLEMALEKGVREVSVYVDSPVVAGHLVEGYMVRADHLRPLVEQVRQLLDEFSTWSLTRVPRKSNLESGLLAKRAITRATALRAAPA